MGHQQMVQWQKTVASDRIAVTHRVVR